MRKALLVVSTGLTLALAAGCGGGSSGGSPQAASSTSTSPSSSASSSGNNAVCERLSADARSVQGTLSSSSNRDQVEKRITELVSKFKTDEANGSPTLKSGVNKIIDVLDAVKGDVERNKQQSTANSLVSKLRSAESDLGKACPNL
jgi:hypothetical protein